MRPGMVFAFIQAARTFLRVLWRVTRQLFHEATGAIFFVFSLAGALSTWRAWRNASELWLVGMAAFFTLLMACFSITSFLSARRVR